MKYSFLVGVEGWPSYFDYNITVTDDVEGFSPSLMASIEGRPVPLQSVRGETALDAALKYFNSLPVRVRTLIDTISVNLEGDSSQYEKADFVGNHWEEVVE